MIDQMTEDEKRNFYILVHKARALKESFVYKDKQFFIENLPNGDFAIRSRRLNGTMEL